MASRFLGGVPLLWRCLRSAAVLVGLAALVCAVSMPFCRSICSFSVLSDPMMLEMACSLIAGAPLLPICSAVTASSLAVRRAHRGRPYHGRRTSRRFSRPLHFVLSLTTTRRGRELRSADPHQRVGTPRGLVPVDLYKNRRRRWPSTSCSRGRSACSGDFFASFRERSSADWAWVIAQHRLWLTLLYGMPLVAIGSGVAAPVSHPPLRGRTRRPRGGAAVFLISTIYIILFRRGSSIICTGFYSAFSPWR